MMTGAVTLYLVSLLVSVRSTAVPDSAHSETGEILLPPTLPVLAHSPLGKLTPSHDDVLPVWYGAGVAKYN